MLTALQTAILILCFDSSSLRPLRTQWGHTALYDAANELVNLGLLERVRRGLWRTTEAGRRALEAEGGNSKVADPIETLWPPISQLPSEVLQNFVRLCVLIVYVRMKRLADTHLISPLLVGLTLSGKTTTGTVLCHGFGVPVEKGMLQAAAEGGLSLLARRKGTGEIAWSREALGHPVVVIDEAHRAVGEVRRLLLLLVNGERRIAYENDAIGIAATPVLLMNPGAPKSAGLERRLGLPEPVLRRLLVADLEGVPLPPDWRTRGARLIDAAAQAGPIRLPEHPVPATFTREDVAHILDTAIRPEAMRLVDVEAIYYWCVAAGAFGYVDPVAAVVRMYAVIAETTGGTKDGWRSRVLPIASLKETAVPPEVAAGVELSALGREVVATAGEEKDLGFSESTAEFRRIADDTGMTPEELALRAAQVKRREEAGLTDAVEAEILGSWRQSGRNPRKTAVTIAGLLDEYPTLQEAVDGLDRQRGVLQPRVKALEARVSTLGGKDRVERAARVLDALDGMRVPLEKASLYLDRFLSQATAAGMEPQEAADHLLWILKIHGDLERCQADHESALLVARTEREAEEAKAQKASQEMALWQCVTFITKEETDVLNVENARLKEENAQLKADNQSLDSDLDAGHSNLRQVLGDAATLGEAIDRANAREQALRQRGEAAAAKEKAVERERAVLLRAAEELHADVDMGHIAATLIYREVGYRRPYNARVLREIADAAEGKALLPPRHWIYGERFRKALLRLARPYILRDYIPKKAHGNAVRGLRRRREAGQGASVQDRSSGEGHASPRGV